MCINVFVYICLYLIFKVDKRKHASCTLCRLCRLVTRHLRSTLIRKSKESVRLAIVRTVRFSTSGTELGPPVCENGLSI
jgi:hypothetical protein